MAFRALHISLGSGEKLQRPFHFHVCQKMDVYAFVSISDDAGGDTQEARTTVDRCGDENPRWSRRMEFDVDEAALRANRLALEFKLMCKRWLADEVIADLTVPVKDLLDYSAGGGGDISVTYDVRNPRGWPKGGKLTFSFKFVGDNEPKLVWPKVAQAQNGKAQPKAKTKPRGKRKRSSVWKYMDDSIFCL